MTKKHSAKQPNYSWVSPYITVNDVDAAMKFYQKAFAFEQRGASPGIDGCIDHAELNYQGQTIMLGKTGAYNGITKPPVTTSVPCPISLYMYCENVDQFYQDAVNAGAKSLLTPADMFWGDRMCSLQDPDGYVWNFATALGEVDIAKESY